MAIILLMIIILTGITAAGLHTSIGWSYLVAIPASLIAVVFSSFLLNAAYSFCLIAIQDLKKVDKKKILIAGAVIFAVLIVYNSCFRYKYRTYKGNYNHVQVIKIDTLTGKSTMTYPEYVEKK